MSLSCDIFLEYLVELVAMEIIYNRFIFSTKIICSVVLGFVTGCPCDAWGRGSTRNPPTLLYVAPLFGKYIPNGLVCTFNIHVVANCSLFK